MSTNRPRASLSDTGINSSLERYSNQDFSAKSRGARLLGFSAAAAGGLLAGSQAEADIQYSGIVNTSVAEAGNLPVNVDFAGDTAGVDNELTLFNSGNTTQTARGFVIGQFTTAGQGFDFMATTSPGIGGVYRGATSMGDASAGQTNFSAGTAGWMGLAFNNAVSTDPWGVFANQSVPQVGIFGFRFDGVTGGGGTGQMFGWMKVELEWQDTNGNTTPGPGDTMNMTLISWAYNDIAGAPIHFGQVPEPSSLGALGLLALGAAGVRRRRKHTD